MRHALLGSLVLVLAAAMPVHAQHILGCDPYSNAIEIHDTAAASLFAGTLQVVGGGTVGGIHAVAQNPVDGRVYVAGDFGPGGATTRRLGLLGPLGAVTDISVVGDLGDFISGMTFGTDGTLYAVTGDGAASSEMLLTVDTATGVTTPLYALGNGTDGEAIAFNSADGLIYHASGRSGFEIFESIDPTNGTITNIGYIGPQFNDDEIQGMVFDPAAGVFYAVDLDSNLMTISPNGLKSPLGVTNLQLRGYALIEMEGFAGTPDDLSTFVSINGAPLQTVTYGGAAVSMSIGDSIVVVHDSIGGQQYFNGGAVVFGSLVLTANAAMIPEPFPGIHLDFPGLFAVYGGVVNGIPLELPFGGITYGFLYSGMLGGTSVVMQAAVSTMASVNGIFASTHGLQIDFL